LRADLTVLRYVPMPSAYEIVNETLGSIKGEEIVDGLGY
jgi:hypothetical protein